MLSRTADALYWMARYTERAENAARLLDVSYRMSLQGGATRVGYWGAALGITGLEEAYKAKHGEITAAHVLGFLAVEPDNPSSILSCLRAARENCHAVRGTVTSEVWETVNTTWLEARESAGALGRGRLQGSELTRFCEWVKFRSHLSRGVTVGTMLQDEAFHFMRLGTFLERADNTARLLDVKFDELAPSGDAEDEYYQWGALLRSVSAFRAYRAVYRDAIRPWRVAELLVLRPDMPRSLRNCFDEMLQTLEALSGPTPRDCHRLAIEIHASLRFGQIDRIVRAGLHEFLDDFVEKNNALGLQVQRDFMMAAPIEQ